VLRHTLQLVPCVLLDGVEVSDEVEAIWHVSVEAVHVQQDQATAARVEITRCFYGRCPSAGREIVCYEPGVHNVLSSRVGVSPCPTNQPHFGSVHKYPRSNRRNTSASMTGCASWPADPSSPLSTLLVIDHALLRRALSHRSRPRRAICSVVAAMAGVRR